MKIEIKLKLVIALILLFLFNNINTYIIFLISITLHELAHLFIGIIIGGIPKKMTISILGVSLEFYSYGKNKSICKIIFYIVGPLINFIIAFFCYYFFENDNLVQLIITTNIVIGIFNLIPILPLDGGKILKEILKNILGFEKSNMIMIYFTKSVLIFLTLIYSVLIIEIKNVMILVLLIYLWYLYSIEEKKYYLYKKTKESVEKLIWNTYLKFYWFNSNLYIDIVKCGWYMRKNNIVFCICIILLLIVLAEVVVYAKKGTQISELNNMYKDIKALEDKIALYYLDNGELPIKREKTIDFKTNAINPNDNSNYYEIDLNKLENMSLFYGNKKKGEKDIYIINEESHTIYYYEGCEYDGKIKYSRELDYEYIELNNY